MFAQNSLIVTLVVFVVTFVSEIVFNKLSISQQDTQLSTRQGTGRKLYSQILVAAFCAVLGFIVTNTAEVNEKVVALGKSNKEIAGSLNTLDKKMMSFCMYVQALEAVGNLKNESPLRYYLEEEFQGYQEKFRQIIQYDIQLKREEVIPCWELLIEKSNEQVFATNIISMDDWKNFSPTSGKDVHQRAMKKGIGVRRILIYDGRDENDKLLLEHKAKEQLEWGENMEIGMIERSWFETSFASNTMRELGTLDIVIYDAETVLLTSYDDNQMIVSATLTHNERRVKTALGLYDKLWRQCYKVHRTAKD